MYKRENIAIQNLEIPKENYSSLKQFLKQFLKTEFNTELSLDEYLNHKKGYKIVGIVRQILKYLLEEHKDWEMPPLFYSLIELHRLCEQNPQEYIECKTY